MALNLPKPTPREISERFRLEKCVPTEGVYNPITMKLYGQGGAEGGMPGVGPTIDEVD